MPDTIRILIVDDHAVVRKGLAMVLRLEPDIEIVGEAENGRTGLETARSTHPDSAARLDRICSILQRFSSPSRYRSACAHSRQYT